jgi:hypothetical protein
MSDPAATPLRSIQGEQARGDWVDIVGPMDTGDVDAYVDAATPGILKCRERGRHDWPLIRDGIHFTDYLDDGLFLRRLRCPTCECAERVETWESYRIGRRTRYRPIASRVWYPGREQYVAPAGRGRLSAKLVRESMASAALSGLSPNALRAQIIREQAQAEDAGTA